MIENTSELAKKFLAAAEFKAVCKIDYNDLDDLITEYFKQFSPDIEYYESVAYEEWGNYESHEFNVSKEDLGDYDIQTIELAKQGKWKHFNLRAYLIHLCNEDIIPECELIVGVFW